METDDGPRATPMNTQSKHTNDHVWVNDTATSKLTEIIFQQYQKDKKLAADAGDEPTTPLETPTQHIIAPTHMNQRLRINIVCLPGTISKLSTLKLFKSFTTTIRNIDPELAILPYQSSKQHYSSLTNIKQIQALDENRLHQFFKGYYQTQYFSLSGYIHLNTSLTYEQIKDTPEVAEWLENHRYYLKLCPSQNEEMIQIGALCYSNIFMYREDLETTIQEHPTWNTNNDPNPPVFDIQMGDFMGNNKKTRMLMLSTEKSKQEQVSSFFKNLYDGTPKEYPNGTMMVYIPIADGVHYTPEHRNKIIFNHEKFLGEEAAIAIG